MRTGRPDLDARLRVAEMPADEPIFILRAQDLCADAAVRHYAQVVVARGGPVALAEKALQQADAMTDWRVRKLPDIDLSEAERLNLEYQHGRRGAVRSGELEVSHAYEQGVAAGVSRERRGRSTSIFEAALRAWTCDACGGAGEYTNHSRDRGEERVPCKRCYGAGLHPTAAKALSDAAALTDVAA